jgi:hypothetical protein
MRNRARMGAQQKSEALCALWVKTPDGKLKLENDDLRGGYRLGGQTT